MIRRPPRSTLDRSSAASDVYKRQTYDIKEKPQARVETGKAHQISNGGSHVAPGDEFSWLLEWRTLATKVPTTSTVTDVLPSQFELITETPPCLEYLGYWEDYPLSLIHI